MLCVSKLTSSPLYPDSGGLTAVAWPRVQIHSTILGQQVRRCIWLQSLLCFGMLWQNVAMDRQRLPDPEGIGEMIPSRICRVRVNQNAKAAMIEHQPWHERGENIPGKGDLKHCPIVRAHFRIVPVAEPDYKALADPRAQPLRDRSRGGRVVIDVGVVARDFRKGPRSGCRFQVDHRSSPTSK